MMDTMTAMSARTRYVETLTFGSPDRIPFEPGGPRESTLRAWHTQGLPDDVPWKNHLLEQIGIAPDALGARTHVPVDFRMIPQFEETVLSHEDGHYVVQDWKGNICEISDEFDITYLRSAKDFVTRRWIRCPVETRDDWERMKARYDVDSSGRIPADLPRRAAELASRDGVLSISLNGPFWQLREWCGFEGLCMMMIEQPDLVAEMASFWTSFISRMLQKVFACVVPDSLFISEDMAYKAKAMISPAMTREFCMPSYVEWVTLARQAGCPIIDMDSDGFVGELIPIWIESGINCCNPMEVAALNDIVAYRAEYGDAIAFRGGVDKRAMAAGGPALHAELDRIEPVVASGGYIPGCDHGVPSDVSWPDFVEYARRLARMTGWVS